MGKMGISDWLMVDVQIWVVWRSASMVFGVPFVTNSLVSKPGLCADSLATVLLMSGFSALHSLERGLAPSCFSAALVMRRPSSPVIT